MKKEELNQIIKSLPVVEDFSEELEFLLKEKIPHIKTYTNHKKTYFFIEVISKNGDVSASKYDINGLKELLRGNTDKDVKKMLKVDKQTLEELNKYNSTHRGKKASDLVKY